MWNWNSLLFKSTSGVAQPAADAGIFLAECRLGEHQRQAHNGKAYRKPSSYFHVISRVSDIELTIEQGSGSAPH
jgi:hypothetical protein